MLDLHMMQRCIALTDPQATKTIIHLQLLSRVMAPSCASPATRRQTHFVNYSIFAGDEVQPKALPSAIFFSLTTNNKSVLRQIKTRTDISCDAFGYYYLAEERHVEERRKSGSVCKRIVVGFALVAFAFQDGRAIQGWHWAGLAGFVLLVTAFFKSCPVYSVLGISTCERPVERT